MPIILAKPRRLPVKCQKPDTALPLTTLDQALIVVFKEAFPLARDQEKKEPASLDATSVQLDNAYLVGANLKQIWGPQASLRNADLSGATLSEANLSGATLFGAIGLTKEQRAEYA